MPRKGKALLSRALLGKRSVLGPEGLRGTITSGAWEAEGLVAGASMTTSFYANGVTVEEAGPVRAVIAIKGMYRPGAPVSGKHYEFTSRLYFTVGSATVRIIHTLRNGRLDPELIVMQSLGLMLGLHLGLLFGGAAVIQHFVLRFILFCNGYIPWNYAHFLDYSVERIFLRKVGGGYMFVHRLLQEYFASLYREQ